MAIDIEAQKQLFKNLVSKNIHRDGIDELMNWLENETDFSGIHKISLCRTRWIVPTQP